MANVILEQTIEDNLLVPKQEQPILLNTNYNQIRQAMHSLLFGSHNSVLSIHLS